MLYEPGEVVSDKKLFARVWHVAVLPAEGESAGSHGKSSKFCLKIVRWCRNFPGIFSPVPFVFCPSRFISASSGKVAREVPRFSRLAALPRFPDYSIAPQPLNNSVQTRLFARDVSRVYISSPHSAFSSIPDAIAHLSAPCFHSLLSGLILK